MQAFDGVQVGWFTATPLRSARTAFFGPCSTMEPRSAPGAELAANTRTGISPPPGSTSGGLSSETPSPSTVQVTGNDAVPRFCASSQPLAVSPA